MPARSPSPLPIVRRVLVVLMVLLVGGCATPPLGPLLVTLADGGVEVADLEGAGVVLEDGGPGLISRQPTWTPGGRLAVWTLIDQNAGEVSVKMGDAENQRRLEAGTAPFFYLSDQTGERVAYLGNAPSGQGVALGVIEVAAGEAALIDGGAPYYLDWAGGGDRLVIHVGNQVLAFLDLEGTRTELAVIPGLFQAPLVLADGNILVVEAGPPQALVMLDPEGAKVRSLAEVEGLSMFTEGGGRVAFTDTAGGAALGPLRVIDLESGETITVHEEGVAAMEWSPTG
ncbi:MAG TPA: hypothetical protein VJR05_08390, partial [Acidimicrobiia bacterium]|nr:hypothetical protein [Acidimicrobiia bacterium]